jgi:hypothetical protein
VPSLAATVISRASLSHPSLAASRASPGALRAPGRSIRRGAPWPGIHSWSGVPSLAATVISRASLENTFERTASTRPLRCMMARAENMPKDNIERAIKKAAGGDAENYEEVRYEGSRGPACRAWPPR